MCSPQALDRQPGRHKPRRPCLSMLADSSTCVPCAEVKRLGTAEGFRHAVLTIGGACYSPSSRVFLSFCEGSCTPAPLPNTPVLGTAKLPAAGVPEGQEDGRAARVAAAQPEDRDDVQSAKAKSSKGRHTWRTGEKHVQSRVPARWHAIGAGRVVSPTALCVDLICNLV